MSKKVSAFQVYSEDQVHQRHARTYRNSLTRCQSNSYKSPPHRGGRSVTADCREDGKMDARQERRSSSPEIRRDRSYNDYDNRRVESNTFVRDSRYGEHIRQSDSGDRVGTQARYRNDEQFDRHSWERDERHNDYAADRDRVSSRLKEDYLAVDARRETASKPSRASAQYSDSDEECLHESLRRKKQSSGQFSDDNDQSEWSTDNNYNGFGQTRKRTLGSSSKYKSPSPPPAKVWREGRQYSSEDEHQNTRNYSDYGNDSDRGQLSGQPPLKKKKMKGSKKMSKAKGKKRKSGNAQKFAFAASTKIQSLMDVEIPSSVKKQVEQSTVSSLPRFGESRAEFKFGQRTEDSSTHSQQRMHDDERGRSRYDESARNRLRYDDDHYLDRQRDSMFGRRDSESDKKGPLSHKDSYSGRRSPDYDRRMYHHSDDEFDRERDRQRKMSFSRDNRNTADVPSSAKRKRQGSVERRDWQRNSNRAQKDRSPDFRAYTDSDQDSDGQGARRSWRDERRDRQPKKKEEERDQGQKGDKKSKSRRVDSKDTKKLTTTKKEKHDSHHSEPRMKVLPCSEGLAVLLTHPQQICIRGRAKVRVLAGEMSVMGHNMDSKMSQTYDLFSPTTSSLLTIQTCSAEKDKKTLRKSLRTLGLDEKAGKDYMSGAVVFLATKLDYPAADYICSYPPFTQLFRFSFDKGPNTQPQTSPEPAKVGAAFMSSDQAMSSFLKVSDDFEDALKKWNQVVKKSKVAPVAVLCGGVHSGKSTFSRYMINSALNSIPKVCYLDCDVGQTEFSPPGTVALTVVDKPVFGPPFCHQTVAESMCFFGSTSPADGPSRYVRCVQHVLQVYQKMEPTLPLIVNTMGWNEGVGLRLFVDILHLLTPDLVIQLNVANSVLNFPAITPEFPALEPGWMYNTEPAVEEEMDKKRKKHELVVVKSLVSSQFDHTRLKLTPKNMRDLALLSHMMQGFSPAVTLDLASSYAIPCNQFAVHICHSPVPTEHVVDTLNASVVALCKADLSEAARTSPDQPLVFDETPICECLGYGLVRAVEEKMLCIVTVMSPERMSQVNTLLRGSVTIPDQLFLKQSLWEDVAYIDALEPATAMTHVRPRTRMPRRN